MDIITIILVIGGVLVSLALIWAAVALIGLVVVRRTIREESKRFDKWSGGRQL